MLSRFLEVKDHLIVVLDELEWDSLTPMQWRDIFNSRSPTAIRASHKYHWCKNTTTIAMVIPVLKELNLPQAKVNPF